MKIKRPKPNSWPKTPRKKVWLLFPAACSKKFYTRLTALFRTDDSWVQVNYRGKLLYGTGFDSSYRAAQPAVFKVGEATPGWREALKLMPAGSKWQLFVLSTLGYVERGANREIIVDFRCRVAECQRWRRHSIGATAALS